MLSMLEGAVESGASAPSSDAVKALADDRQEAAQLQAKWNQTLAIELPKVNALLRSAGLSPLIVTAKSQSATGNEPVSFEND